MAISLANPPRYLGMDQNEVQHPLMKPLSYNGGYDSSGINPNGMYTGGVLPAQPLSQPMGTGGVLPAQPVTTTAAHPVQTGGALPAQVVQTAAGPVAATAPAATAAATKPATDINSLLQNLWGSVGGNQALQNPAELANQYMAQILGADSPYIQSARQHGVEQANARGMLNSSIAAGASQRAAIDAAQPMFQAATGLNAQRENNNFQGMMQRTQLGMGLLGQRENNAFQGDQAQRDRNLKIKLQSDAAYQQDWLSNQDFTRQFNAALSMIPIQTANQFMQNIQQYAIENPEIYTPQMINGMQNFFSQSMATLLAKYFPKGGTS